MSEIDRYSPSEDDEDAPGLLLKPFTQDCHPVLATCDRSNAMADAILALSGKEVPSRVNVQYQQWVQVCRSVANMQNGVHSSSASTA